MERKDAGVSSGVKAKASKNKDAHTHTHKHRRAPQLSRWRRRRYRCGCKAEGKQPSAAAAYEAKQRQVEPRPPAAVLNPGILTGGSAVGCAFPASEFLPKTAFKPDHPDINTHPDCLAPGSAGGRDGGGGILTHKSDSLCFKWRTSPHLLSHEAIKRPPPPPSLGALTPPRLCHPRRCPSPAVNFGGR